MDGEVSEPTWQKSSYSGEAANCVNVAAMPDDTLHLRESDDPDRILAVNREGLSALLTAVKSDRLSAIALT
ncbi:DUF397 domain-containing protein [Streptomyces sp. W16]|uniref:DUF397 domain-containing protein n=1 Tax=Streptomyces sp. W16 TaxID=3076631 RepID=UPI00295B38BA|nr:DUF397 domain-containing protein [Streptomyces sp. W16]MDV9169465.1 DUF397 domain-containing protein [Streptomyces sp. W16]